MLDQSGDEIAMPKDLIDYGQKIGVKWGSEKYTGSNPVPLGDALRPDVMI